MARYSQEFTASQTSLRFRRPYLRTQPVRVGLPRLRHPRGRAYPAAGRIPSVSRFYGRDCQRVCRQQLRPENPAQPVNAAATQERCGTYWRKKRKTRQMRMSVRHLRRPAMPAIRIIPSTPGLYSLPFRTTVYSPASVPTDILSTSAICSSTGSPATGASIKSYPQPSILDKQLLQILYRNQFYNNILTNYNYLWTPKLNDTMKALPSIA